jgi:hypothetical protein
MKKSLFLIFVSATMLFLGGCYYDWIVPEEVPTIPDDVEVSFAQSILPIFNTGNNCTACHRSGGTSPDLTTANAYNQLNTSKYINLTTPEESAIYKVPNASAAKQHHKVYTAQQAALVLAWIKQGAKNN